MFDSEKVLEMARTIKEIRQLFDRLLEQGKEINCVERNVERMSACLKMLELNINDAADLHSG
ncbi:MAG: hypothetical protein ACOY4I_08745 [Bacillota bacterium]